MNKYKKKTNGEEVEVLNFQAAGMGKHTIGTTYVLYRYIDSNLQYPFVMTSEEFKSEYEIVK